MRWSRLFLSVLMADTWSIFLWCPEDVFWYIQDWARYGTDLKLLGLGSGHCSSSMQTLQKCLGHSGTDPYKPFCFACNSQEQSTRRWATNLLLWLKWLLCLCFLHVCICKFITNGEASWQVISGKHFPLFLDSLQLYPDPWHMLDCNWAPSPEFINQPFAVFIL